MTYAIRKTENGEHWYLHSFVGTGDSTVVNWSTDKRRAGTAANEADAKEVLDYAKAFDAGAPPDAEYEIVEEAA